MNRKTLIFVHGYDVNAPNWQEVVWGVAPHRLGRATQGLYVAWQMFPDSDLAFGSGGTTREFLGEPLKEAAYTRAFLLNVHDCIGEFEKFQHIRPVNHRWLRQKLDTAHIEVQSHNTFSESKYIVQYAAEQKYNTLVVVSDKAHAFRCILHAAQAMEAQGLIGAFDLLSCMSPAPNTKQTAGNCVALEPGLDDSNPMGDIVKAYWGLPNERKADSIAQFHDVVNRIKATA